MFTNPWGLRLAANVLKSYRYLTSAVGSRRARQLSRAELVLRVARRLGGPGWQASQPPTLDALVGSAPSVTTATDVLKWLGLTQNEISELLREFEGVTAEIEAAYSAAELTCPPEWAVESSTSAVLYCLTRIRKPASVIETGIANGHSSFVVLSAMHRNGVGHLASIDIRPDVGGLVPSSLAGRWNKVIITGQRPGLDLLRERLRQHGPVDIFFHDGDHRFLGQMLDYRIAQELLWPDGILMSDDINTTSAWLDAGALNILPPRRLVLLDRRKAVGFATAATRPE